MKQKKLILLSFLIIFFILFSSTVNAVDNSTTTKKSIDNTKIIKNTQLKDDNAKTDSSIKTISKKDTENTNNNVKSDSVTNNSYNINLNYTKLKNRSYNFTAKITDSNSKKVKNGTMLFKLDNKEYKRNITKGISTLKYNFKEYGRYKIVAYYDNYTYSSNNLNLKVNEANMTIKTPKKQDITQYVTVTTKVVDDEYTIPKSKLEFYLNNQLYATKKLETSKLSYNISVKKLGLSTIKVKYISAYNRTIIRKTQVNITRKYERIKLIAPSSSKTQKTIKFKVQVTNNTEKLNVGTVRIKYDNQTVLAKSLENGVCHFNYTLPVMAGIHNLTAEYFKGITLVGTTKKIKLKNSEKMNFKVKSKVALFSDYNFTVKIRSPYANVSHGNVMIKFNKEIITNQTVVNGSVTFQYTMPLITKKYKVVAYYFKFDKKVQHVTRYVKVYKPSYIYVSKPHILVNGSGKLGQINPHTCGPHSLYQNLYKFGIKKYSEWDIANIMGTSSAGTSHGGINWGITYISRHSKYKLSNYWTTFSSLGSNTDARFKKLGKIISNKNTGVIIHNLYRLTWGHYETVYGIDTKNRQVFVLNSLGYRQGVGYWGYVEKRSYDTFASYIANTPGGQKSLCVITKKKK